MDAAFYIARRYLLARKSHNVINVISAISAAGMAIGTAALILILSVYNGFDRIIESNLSDLDPDVLVTPADGRRFTPAPELLGSLSADGRVSGISCVLEENVLLVYGERQGIALAKGVDRQYVQDSPLSAHVTAGEFSLEFGDVEQAAVGAGLAREMGINPRFLDKLKLCYPRSGAGNPLTGPASSLGSVSVVPSCLFSIDSETDAGTVIVPIETMRRLLGEDSAVTGIELRTSVPADRKMLREIGSLAGPGFKVLDREMQRPAIYRMMKYEKLAIYSILIFVVVIVAFNIFGSLSMLKIEKSGDMMTLKAMGATGRFTRRIFVFEGWLVSLSGLAAGLLAGISAALLQQHFGLVSMPGGFMVSAYPCVLEAGDVLMTAGGVALTGFLISLLAARGKS